MREARIILPLAGQSTIRTLTELFGGVTVYDGHGTWTMPNGTVLSENVKIVDIAYEQTQTNDAKLYDIAWAYGQSASQQEVYLRYGNGHVQMVTERSCMDNGEFDWHSFLADIKATEDLDRETVSDVEIDLNRHVEVTMI